MVVKLFGLLYFQIACQQQNFRQRRTVIKNFLKNYKTEGELEEIMHNILSSLYVS